MAPLSAPGCGPCARWLPVLRSCLQLAVEPGDGALRYWYDWVNITSALASVGAPVYAQRVAGAVAEAWSCALAVRVLAERPEPAYALYRGLHRSWSDAWCGARCALAAAARSLPPAGHLATALNVSAAELVLERLPQALEPILSGLATGTVPLEGAQAKVDNITNIFVEYIDYAVLLGEEAARFGRQRVRRAVFHGQASSAGETGIHRAYVLGWLLGGGELGPAGRGRLGDAPRMLELGVNSGLLAGALLRSHSTLRWYGADPYLGDIWTHGGLTVTADSVREVAEAAIAPYSDRARLFVAESLRLDLAAVGPQGLHLLFVDGLHDEESAYADIVRWAPLVLPGCYVAGHDYRSGYKGVVRAVHAALPRGATLHLAPDGVFWWRAPPGRRTA